MQFWRVIGLAFGLSSSLSAYSMDFGKKEIDWVLVENSPLILTAKLEKNKERRAIHEFTDLYLSDSKIIIGKIKGYFDGKSYVVPYFISDEKVLKDMRAKEGKELVIFAMPCTNDRGEICLVDNANASMFVRGESQIAKIENLNKENETLYKKGFDKCKKIENKSDIDRLIAQLDRSKIDQKFALDQLIEMGPAIVPYLICRMPYEFKPFRMKSLIVENHDRSSFEQHAMYSPALKVGVLDFILSAITGVQFTPLTNGGTDKDRERTIRGWVIYLQRNSP